VPEVVRTLVVWCPDWSVVATALPSDQPVAVFAAGRVLSCSAPARAVGVEVGLRRRQAEARCPPLVVVDHDAGRDARAFEPVVAAVESVAPRVEVTRPGVCSVATRGPSRYFGGDEALATLVAGLVDDVLGVTGACRVGVADGPFAAEQAARLAVVVPPGATAVFLAPLPTTTLVPSVLAADEGTGLVDLWGRLGIRTLGDLAALPAPAVTARFGPAGAGAHRLAQGLDERPLWARTPPPDLAVATELDPPVESVETAAFVAKSLADQLFVRLAEQGLAATRVGIEAETEHGEALARLWRLEGAGWDGGPTSARRRGWGPAGTEEHSNSLDAAALAQRVRWQLEGWLLGRSGAGGGASGAGPTAGITLLRLVPDEVRPDAGRQQGFWGGDDKGAERAARALVRLQGMLGHEAVVTAVVAGGRGPVEQARLVPWGDARPPTAGGAEPCGDPAVRAQIGGTVPGRRRPSHPAPGNGGEVPPWPGRLPPPAPASVHPDPWPAEVVDAGGAPVGVTGRARATARPARLSIAGGPWAEVAAWAGPWPLDERWWDARDRRRRARWQIVTITGAAHLLAVESGRWTVEATYD